MRHRNDGVNVRQRIGTWARAITRTALVVTLVSTAAWAHMMPAQQGTLNIIDNAVFAALSLPVSGLSGVDDNADGRLSWPEVAAHVAAIQSAVSSRIRLTDGKTPGRLDLVMPRAEPDERDSTSLAGSTSMLVLMKVTFEEPPRALRIDATFFGTKPGERQLTIKATRGTEAEAVVLTPARTTHAFFRAPWQVLRDYVVVGAAHILGGTDHLLFLLTLIVAAAGWRYWLWVLTSFTVAHSLSLSLSMFGLVRVPPTIVEPLIAASIVLMAILNLRPRAPSTASVPSHRIALVFACGLLHGLGFAGSMADMGLHGAYRVTSIVGFNVGIELGQALFLLAMLALGRVWQWLVRTPPLQRHGHRFATTLTPVRVVSGVAVVLGSLWFVERVTA